MGSKGNSNALKDGAYSRIPVSRLPPSLAAVRKRVYAMRSVLEKVLMEQSGSITPLQACYLHSALSHECIAAIWERRVRVGYEAAAPGEMDSAQLAEATDRISRERDRRDSALAKLGLDKPVDPFASLYATPWPALAVEGDGSEVGGANSPAAPGGDAGDKLTVGAVDASDAGESDVGALAGVGQNEGDSKQLGVQ
jgi:hypothetical protein